MSRRLISSPLLRRIAASAWLALAPAAPLLTGGCSTPSVPIPPPGVDMDALTFSASGTGELVLRGRATTSHANVRFFAINEATGDGVITTTEADGSFESQPLPANAGDTARFYFETTDNKTSSVTCAVIVLDAPLFGETCQ